MLRGPTVKSSTGWSNAEARTSCCGGASRKIHSRSAPSCRLKDIRQRTVQIEQTAAALRLRTAGDCSSAARIRTFLRSRDNEQKIFCRSLDHRNHHAYTAGGHGSSKESLDSAKDTL